jgi:hypothetical protein
MNERRNDGDEAEAAQAAQVIRSFSFGGGVQSTAALVLQVQGRIDYDHWLFANVGDDSEHPATLKYVREVSAPYALANGITIHELHRVKRDGTSETLFGRLMRDGSRSLPIPVRMPDTGAPGTRSCTADFKIRVIGRRLRELGATKENPARVGLGISVDEIARAKPGIDPKAEYQYREYPLLDLEMTRADCLRVVADAGLPPPPKSACWFCPFHRPLVWREMKRDEPELFDRAVELERVLNERRDTLGRDHVYLTRFGKPLDEAISPDGDQLSLLGNEDEDGCESGYCLT